MVCVLYSAIRRATFDKFGEEGLKAGVVTSEGGIHMYIKYTYDPCKTTMRI